MTKENAKKKLLAKSCKFLFANDRNNCFNYDADAKGLPKIFFLNFIDTSLECLV